MVFEGFAAAIILFPHGKSEWAYIAQGGDFQFGWQWEGLGLILFTGSPLPVQEQDQNYLLSLCRIMTVQLLLLHILNAAMMQESSRSSSSTLKPWGFWNKGIEFTIIRAHPVTWFLSLKNALYQNCFFWATGKTKELCKNCERENMWWNSQGNISSALKRKLKSWCSHTVIHLVCFSLVFYSEFITLEIDNQSPNPFKVWLVANWNLVMKFYNIERVSKDFVLSAL